MPSLQVDVGIYTAREGVLQLLGGVVGLYRFRLYDDGGVAALHVLTLRGDGSRYVARRQSQRYRQAGQQGCHSRGCDFVDLLLCHDCYFLRFSSRRFCDEQSTK